MKSPVKKKLHEGSQIDEWGWTVTLLITDVRPDNRSGGFDAVDGRVNFRIGHSVLNHAY